MPKSTLSPSHRWRIWPLSIFFVFKRFEGTGSRSSKPVALHPMTWLNFTKRAKTTVRCQFLHDFYSLTTVITTSEYGLMKWQPLYWNWYNNDNILPPPVRWTEWLPSFPPSDPFLSPWEGRSSDFLCELTGDRWGGVNYSHIFIFFFRIGFHVSQTRYICLTHMVPTPTPPCAAKAGRNHLNE